MLSLRQAEVHEQALLGICLSLVAGEVACSVAGSRWPCVMMPRHL